ncbi:MAG: 6-bladed beta-propeller [Acidobacteria bacterium]|nr:6-bladed beta-propeller [Acidobacteriota bacterium]MCB9396579.1 6-bladed beta-propeller [Acidobacteriota bacterium]
MLILYGYFLVQSSFFDYLPVKKIVQLELTDNSVVAEYLGCIVYQGGIVVYDRPNSHPILFDEGGKFLKVIGSIGSGPFEFRGLSGIAQCWGGEYFAIADGMLTKLIVFDKNGDPVYETPVGIPAPIGDFYWPNKNSLVITEYFPNDSQFIVSEFDPEKSTKPVKGLVPFPEGRKNWHGSIVFYKGIVPFNSNVFVSDLYHSSIDIFDSQFNKIDRIHLPGDAFLRDGDLVSRGAQPKFPHDKDYIRNITATQDFVLVDVKAGSYVINKNKEIEAIIKSPFGPAIFSDGNMIVHQLPIEDSIDQYANYPDDYQAIKQLKITDDENPLIRISTGKH